MLHPRSVLALVLIASVTSVALLPLSAQGRKRTEGPARGVWVKQGEHIVKIPLRAFRQRFGVSWARRQLLGPGLTEARLPGYSDGPGSFDWEKGEESTYVGPQYVPSAADLAAINGRTARVYLGKVDEHVGHGLFARAPIRVGQPIGEYTGVARAEDMSRDHLNAYTWTYDPWNAFRMVIDAKDQGNYLRFANHSSNHANATARLVYDRDHRRWHVLIVAKQKIRKGDQILYDYSSSYDWSRFGVEPADLRPRAD